MERRQFVSTIAASTVLSAGCVSDSAPAPDDGNSENDSDPDETDNAEDGNSTNKSNETMGWHGDPDINSPDDSGMELQDPPSCGESLIPLSDKFDEVEYGQFEYETGATFELEVEPDPAALGEEITATLRWVSGEDGGFGTGEMYTVERGTDDGWESIYRVPASQSWTAMASGPPESSPPATWFEWSLTLTQDGMEKPTLGETPYAVCDPLEPGTYRFVYWGVSSPEGMEDTDFGIGSEFTVTE